jgi:hypothetical protein
VETAKIKARDLMGTFQKTGSLPTGAPALIEENVEIYGGNDGDSPEERLARFLRQARPGDYVSLMAYLPRSDDTDQRLNRVRLTVRDRFKVATTIGYGPRFLHSTGQLHKGGGNNGLFLQITHAPKADIAIPGEPYTFGVLLAAQAMGDYQVLAERGRRLIRFHIKGSIEEGLRRLEKSLSSHG